VSLQHSGFTLTGNPTFELRPCQRADGHDLRGASC
jgi:hypothetical protein